MRNFAFLVLMTAACGSDPTPRPVIDVVSPTAGDYGTKVAVTGHHLENQRVTASGPTIAAAVTQVYAAVNAISWDGMICRRRQNGRWRYRPKSM